MIVHQVKTGGESTGRDFTEKRRNIYVSSARTDLKFRDMLVNFRHRWEYYIHGSLEFTICDRSGVTPEQWKQRAENKIRLADGVIMLVSENTVHDEDALWEIDMAFSHNVPIVGVDVRSRFKGALPEKLVGKMTRYGWEWFANFINGI